MIIETTVHLDGTQLRALLEVTPPGAVRNRLTLALRKIDDVKGALKHITGEDMTDTYRIFLRQGKIPAVKFVYGILKPLDFGLAVATYTTNAILGEFV